MKISKWNINLFVLVIPCVSLIIFGLPLLLAQEKKDKEEVISAEQIIKDIKTYQKETENIRGRKFKSDITAKKQSLEDFQQFVRKSLDEELPPEKAQLIQTAWSKLGLTPKTFDLRKGLEDLQVSQAGAYYDNKTKTVYLLKTETLPPSFVKMAMVHELCHALQDQHFDLTTIRKNSGDSYDYSAATRFLYEGDASYVGNFYYAKPMFATMGVDIQSDSPLLIQQFMIFKSMSRTEILQKNDAQMESLGEEYPAIKAMLEGAKKAPPYLYWYLAAPYVSGVASIAEIMGFTLQNQGDDYIGGWQNIDIAYKVIPVSTEQMLHPYKLLIEKDDPTQVAQPKFPDSWEVVHSDNLGEFGFWTLYDIFEVKDSRQAAAGWDGDKYFLIKNKKDNTYGLYFSTIWDSDADAKDSFKAYQKIVAKKYPDWQKDKNATEQFVMWNSPDGKFTVVMTIENNKWTTVEDIPAETTELWKTPPKKD